MTDYLLREQPDALLEQLRRLERAVLPARREETREERAAGRGPEEESHAPWAREQVWHGGRAAGSTAAPGQVEELRRFGGGTALARQLRELDWAAALAGGHAPAGREAGGALWRARDGGSDAPGGPGTALGWQELEPPAGWSGPKAGGGRGGTVQDMGWVEQADRIFQRDSRRYDGGFYLY